MIILVAWKEGVPMARGWRKGKVSLVSAAEREERYTPSVEYPFCTYSRVTCRQLDDDNRKEKETKLAGLLLSP